MASRTPGSGSSGIGKATAAAIRMLQDEQVREQLIAAGTQLASQLREWNDDRRRNRPPGAAPGAPGPAGAVPATTGARARLPSLPPFGHEKLERRADHLEGTVDLLRRSAGPEALRSLDGVDAAIDRIRLALAVSKNLPTTKRRRARKDIADSLDELEDAVLDAAMGRAGGPTA